MSYRSPLMFTLLLIMAAPLAAADLQGQGRELLAQGDNAAAAKKFAEAAQINPFDAAALNNQALASAARGDYETALGLLERAARLAPQRTDIAANLQAMRAWIARNVPPLSEKSPPPAYVDPDADLPAPPALWKK